MVQRDLCRFPYTKNMNSEKNNFQNMHSNSKNHRYSKTTL